MSFKKEIQQKSQEYAKTIAGVGSSREQELIQKWRVTAPKMVASLERQGILAEYAHVTEIERQAQVDKYLRAGLGPDGMLMSERETDRYDNQNEIPSPMSM